MALSLATGIVVYCLSGVIGVGGFIKTGIAGFGYMKYKWRKRRYKNKIKSGIMDRDFERVNKYFHKLKSFDFKHQSTIHKRLMKLYGINSDIINDETLFYKHYRVKIIQREDDEISYVLERSMTLQSPPDIIEPFD